MRYFFPDSQDLVDPSFDFETERRSINRVRQRDDEYAHEVFAAPPFDGLLVSKGIVDGFGAGTSGRYTAGQRHRLLRLGAPEFFRVDSRKPPLEIMGDCGAFTYVKEPKPPYTVDDLLDFYEGCQFDLGLSLDHVILQFVADEKKAAAVDGDVKRRQKLTLTLAAEFLRKHKSRKCKFTPIGVAQGWSAKSYATSVEQLQKMGYRYIALGGMVPLKTHEILSCLETIQTKLKPASRLHLLGVTRTEHITTFERYGVTSFDSTSPLRQAFKDDRDNYYTMESTFTAIRIPQVEGNPSLQKLIQSGARKQETARELERRALSIMKAFDEDKASVEEAIAVLREYEKFYDPAADHTAAYERTLSARPWRACSCEVCRRLRYHVILFRGAERNRRRGFHNVWTFFRRVRNELRNQNGEAA